MKYLYPVTDINNYDLDLLAQEIKSAGLSIQAIHSGNGVLIFEFQVALTDAEKTVMQGIVTAHSPVWFEYAGEGLVPSRHKVKCAEDVDRLTGMRIRSLIGGQDPIQEQLKLVTDMLRGVVLDMLAATSLADLKTLLSNRIQEYKNFLDKRETIIQQGKDFKTGKGW